MYANNTSNPSIEIKTISDPFIKKNTRLQTTSLYYRQCKSHIPQFNPWVG